MTDWKAKCPKCGVAISYLHYYNDGVTKQIFDVGYGPLRQSEGEPRYSDVQFIDDGHFHDYDCPKCGETLFHSEDDAVKFLRSGWMMCLTAIVRADGFIVGLVREGERGYYPMESYGHFKTYEEAQSFADNYNEKLGVPPKEACEIVLRSMRRDVPAREDVPDSD